MEQADKRFMARILGEVFRLQYRIDPELCSADENTVFGLIAGVESTIDELFEERSFLTRQNEETVAEYLQQYFEKDDPEGLNYRAMERDLGKQGIDRMQIKLALTNFLKTGSFIKEIEHLQQQALPVELGKLEPRQNQTLSPFAQTP